MQSSGLDEAQTRIKIISGYGGFVVKSCLALETPTTIAVRLLCPWDSPCKNTKACYHFLLQGIRPRFDSWVSCIAGRFFTNWDTREANKIVGRNINNLEYTGDTTIMAESEEELKDFLMKMKEDSGKVGLKSTFNEN